MLCFFLSFSFVLLALGIFVKNSDYMPEKYAIWGNVISLVGISLVMILPASYLAKLIYFNALYPVFYISVLLFSYGVLVAIIGCWIWGVNHKFYISISLCGSLLICALVTMSFMKYNHYYDNIAVLKEQNTISDYAPFSKNSKVAVLKDEPILKLDKELPVLDGIDAFYPVYSSFVKAVYPQPEEITTSDFTECEYLYCTSATEAYRKLVNGDADIIFVSAPSEEQSEYADKNNVKLIYTPIGKEAFVFFVNAKNPISGLSADKIRGIYSGEIKNWSELGISDLGEILSFQRHEKIGCQSILKRFMKGQNLLDAPQENIPDGMGGIINKTADYRNYDYAIGFSFRFNTMEM